MKKQKPVKYIYYKHYWNCVRDTRYLDNWVEGYDFLTAEDAELVACDWGNMKRDRIKKLINHTNEKFNIMRTRKVMIMKIFSLTPVVYISASEQLRAEALRLIEKTKDEKVF